MPLCDKCNSTGYINDIPCPKCHTTGYYLSRDEFNQGMTESILDGHPDDCDCDRCLKIRNDNEEGTVL